MVTGFDTHSHDGELEPSLRINSLMIFVITECIPHMGLQNLETLSMLVIFCTFEMNGSQMHLSVNKFPSASSNYFSLEAAFSILSLLRELSL